jgi:hypothetical protein
MVIFSKHTKRILENGAPAILQFFSIALQAFMENFDLRELDYIFHIGEAFTFFIKIKHCMQNH